MLQYKKSQLFGKGAKMKKAKLTKGVTTRKKISVSLDIELVEFFEHLQEKEFTKLSWLVEHLLMNGITATDDIREKYDKFWMEKHKDEIK